MSKGSTQRKPQVSDKQVTDNWERIRRNSKNWGKPKKDSKKDKEKL